MQESAACRQREQVFVCAQQKREAVTGHRTNDEHCEAISPYRTNQGALRADVHAPGCACCSSQVIAWGTRSH